MTEEEFVRANWAEVRLILGPGNPYKRPSERLGYVAYSLPSGHEITISGGPQFEAWAAAAEFTRERLEQIRQLGLEVEAAYVMRVSTTAAIKGAIRRGEDDSILLEDVRTVCAWQRILASRESALADLRQGMRTAAPDGARSDAND